MSFLAFDISVTTTSQKLRADDMVRDYVVLLADIDNTNTIMIGGVGSQPFPLVAGAGHEITKTQLSLIYVVSVSGTQILHVDCGGN